MLSSPIRRNGYQCVLQLSEEDCGAACLASICKYHGRLISISRSREAVGTGQLGTTLLGLKRGFENLGFKTRSVKASPDILDRLKELPLPGVIHWKGYHWVVLYGKRGNKYVVADPALGIRYLKRAELVASWNGIMLLLEPDVESLSQQSETDTSTGFGRFLRRILPYRGLIFGVLAINIVLGLLSLASPFLLQILTDDVLVRQDTQLLTVVIIAVVIMTLFNGALQLLQSTLVAHFSQRLQLGFVLDFGRKILNLPLSYYETRRSGEIVSRLRDINDINQLVSQIVALLPSQFFVAFISFCFMVFYSWKLTLAVTLIGVLMTCSTLPFMPILQQATRKLLVLSSENQGVLVETFKGALVIKATNAAPQFWEEFQTRFGRLANITFNTVQISIVNGIFSQMVSSIGSISLLGFGSLLVISKELSIGQLLAFNSLQGNVLALMGSLIGLVDEYFRTQTAVTRLGEVIDATPEVTTTTQKPHAQLPGNADIHCKSLNFHHAGRLELMEDFSLTLPGGCAIALIGKSGCGKSTLAKLIAGLYQPNSGNIRIDCFNLQDLSLESLRQQIVYVPQDAHFWSRSIIENFRLGTPYISFEQIVKACQLADADDFISQLPNKYQTVLGEFGANLSGGQRQRLAIARGIVTDPPILILDESTAGLDPVSEANVLDKLLAYRKGRTTIMITHRPSVIERADWVTLLDKGKVLVQGNLQKLRSFPGEHLKFISY
ncbi:peptidase domain-containing ABC transporter [Nostocaceae cyanobacterium CENA369]|uniref:Peptidase domain-containing ABC transporter n=1 Tax=Dendronalium phyllosphericum CENA369 TaxID=1725256 RepID=A0A8J7LFG5_9NOST|nr:peptidase domain-containing ABC transporter [Dendronalium phyllosphericum]MBH8575186.1 peptidase domain-containing ABC transporter [Dendronalium phyllosphericum CENA369]